MSATSTAEQAVGPTALTKQEVIEIVKQWAADNEEFPLNPMTAEEMVQELWAIENTRTLNYGLSSETLPDEFPQIVKKYAPDALHEKPAVESSKPNDGIALARDCQTAEPKPWLSFGKAMPNWWMLFSGFDDLEDGGIKMYIENFIPEGVTIISSLPKEGKTWLALSISKALTSGKPLFGRPEFAVPESVPVLYLAAEVGDRPFKQRLRKFGITNDKSKFLCRTLSKGMIGLRDTYLHQVVHDLKPVIILDVLSCFNQSDDEDDSVQNQNLRIALMELRHAGARAVIILHHSTKNFKQKPTKENAVRGSGDILAMVDVVWALMLDDRLYQSSQIEEVDVMGWGRDFSPSPFRFGLTRKGVPSDGNMYKDGVVSVIDTTGDLGFIDKAVARADRVRATEQTQKDIAASIDRVLQDNPAITVKGLIDRSGQSRRTIDRVVKELGWTKPSGRAKKGETNQWVKNAA